MKTIYRCMLLLAVIGIGSVAALGADAADVPPYQLPVVNFAQDRNGFYINAKDEFYLRYMWDSFVALNWPAKRNDQGVLDRGMPDTQATGPAMAKPVVWETYPQPQDVFLLPEGWHGYPTWDTIQPRPPVMGMAKCDGYSPSASILLYAINQPNITIKDGPVAPLMDQYGHYVRYQVNLNRPYFEYIAQQRYYNAEAQQTAVAISEKAQYEQRPNPPEGGFVSIPFDRGTTPGMLETKAAWRLLRSEDDASRYYTRTAFVISPDGTTCERALAGLVALHIHRITRLSHVASTFEHIDNVDIVDPSEAHTLQPSFNPGTANLTQQNVWPPYGNRGFRGELPPVITAKDTLPPLEHRQPTNISRATPITRAVAHVNEAYQRRYEKSVLRYYQMVDTQHAAADCKMKETGVWHSPQQWEPVTCPQSNIHRLINTALESYTQLLNPFTGKANNYSCQSCHSHARPCGFVQEEKNALTWRAQFQVMSYLLSKATFPGQTDVPEGYACNNPVTQPFKPVPRYAIATANGNYLTAVAGGGKKTDSIRADATQIGSDEVFLIVALGGGEFAVQTRSGYYLTAEDGGGRKTDAIRTNETGVRAWERFRLQGLGGDVYAIQVSNGNYLGAVGGGGQTTNAMTSNSPTPGAFERFRLVDRPL